MAPTTMAPTTMAALITTAPTTTAAPTTTPAPTTPAMIPAPTTTPALTATIEAPTVVILSTDIDEPYLEELNNTSSTQYIDLEARFIDVCNGIFSAKYGNSFNVCYVIEFSESSNTSRAGQTNAKFGVVFAQTNSTQEIPKAADVAKTLIDAVSNSTFNVTFVAASVTVLQTTVLNSTTTSPNIAATTAASAATTAASAATTAASAATTAASAATTDASAATTAASAATTAASAATTVTPTTRLLVTFRSQGETFTSDLLVPSSATFQNRSALIESTLKPLLKEAFPSFHNISVISFSEGSIIQNVVIEFLSTSAPNGTEIGKVFAAASCIIRTFNIDTFSISVDGTLFTQVSSGVSHNISLITASFLVLMSWILSSQQ
ncbi:ice-structuring glycoprotein-like [Cyclopterus lumpus]|uniref:ice-structuring glycoprotein-like n=1 Tax=Cyclopterus lumpus TaxID=8103 RepID=UPI001486B873|nr:ice-structuring glycoprotein-like [Cyclopterus lumpus]